MLTHRNAVFSWLAAGIVLLLPAVTVAQNQVAGVIALAGYQPLMDDINYLGGLTGMPRASGMVEGMLGMMTGGQGLAGIDQARPWGVVLSSDGQNLSGVACLPVSDFAALLQVVEAAGGVVQAEEAGITRLTLQGQNLVAQHQNGWALVAQAPAHLSAAPADPAATFAPLLTEADLGVHLNGQQLPPMYKQMLLGGIVQGMQQSLQQQAGESDEQFQLRKTAAQEKVANLQQMMEGLDQLDVRLAINPSSGGLQLDLALQGVPGSMLAVQSPQATGSRFGGFRVPTAALQWGSSYQLPPAAREQAVANFQAQAQGLQEQFNESLNKEESLPSDETREALQSIFADLLASVEAMVRSGQFDAMSSVSTERESFSLLAAVATPEPERIRDAVEKGAALAAKDPQLPQIEWAATTHRGVDIHTLQFPLADRQWKDLLGAKLEVAIGIGLDQVCLAVGADAVQKLTSALDGSPSSTEVAPLHATLSLAPLMSFLSAASQASNQPSAIPGMMAQLLSRESSDEIRFQMLSIPNGAQYRLTIESGVLNAVGAAAGEVRAQMVP